MVRLLKMTLTFWLQSLGFMLPYLILGILIDKKIFLIWGLIYPLQFVGAIVYNYAEGIASLSIVRGNKRHNSNEASIARNTGIIFLAVYLLCIAILSCYFMEDYLNYFGGWGDYVIPCIIANISYTIYCIFWYKAYIEEIQGNGVIRYGIIFFCSSMMGVIVSLLCHFQNAIYIVSSLFIFNLIGLVYILIEHYIDKGNRVKPSLKLLLAGFNAMPKIASSFIHCIIYVIGYRRTGVGGESMILTLSTLGIFFDSAWDAGASAYEHYEALADNGNKDMVYPLLGRMVILGLILPIMPVTLMIITDSIDNIILVVAEALALIVYPINSLFKSYFHISTPLVVGTTITLVTEIIRLWFTWIIPSAYSSEYSIIVTYTISIIGLAIAHRIHRKTQYNKKLNK